MLKNIPYVATRNHVERTILSICCVNSRPCPDSRLCIKPIAEIEFVLMPRETETDLRCLPDKQIIDAEEVWTENVNEWKRSSWGVESPFINTPYQGPVDSGIGSTSCSTSWTLPG